MNQFKQIIFFSLIILIAGCAGKAFKQAQQENTVEAYNNFLKDYENSSFAIEAKELREKAIYKRTIMYDTIEKYDNYMKEYPNGRFIKEIKTAREKRLYNKCKQSMYVKYCDDYLLEYVNGSYETEVKKIREDIYFEKAKLSNNLSYFSSYLKEYPNGQYIIEAANAIENIKKKQSEINKLYTELLNRANNYINNDIYKAISFINTLRHELLKPIKPKDKYETTNEFSKRKEQLYKEQEAKRKTIKSIFDQTFTISNLKIVFTYDADNEILSDIEIYSPPEGVIQIFRVSFSGNTYPNKCNYFLRRYKESEDIEKINITFLGKNDLLCSLKNSSYSDMAILDKLKMSRDEAKRLEKYGTATIRVKLVDFLNGDIHDCPEIYYNLEHISIHY